jgi:hypothetical protein
MDHHGVAARFLRRPFALLRFDFRGFPDRRSLAIATQL